MLPPFIIDQIRKREEQERRQQEPEPLQLPLPDGPVPVSTPWESEPAEEGKRGVVIIDLAG